MCKWNKWGDKRIDPCMENLIEGFDDSPMDFGKNLDNTINSCSEEECQELNMKLDCYQIDKNNEK